MNKRLIIQENQRSEGDDWGLEAMWSGLVSESEAWSGKAVQRWKINRRELGGLIGTSSIQIRQGWGRAMTERHGVRFQAICLD